MVCFPNLLPHLSRHRHQNHQIHRLLAHQKNSHLLLYRRLLM